MSEAKTLCSCDRPILVDERVLSIGVRDIKCGRRIQGFPLSLPKGRRVREALALAR